MQENDCRDLFLAASENSCIAAMTVSMNEDGEILIGACGNINQLASLSMYQLSWVQDVIAGRVQFPPKKHALQVVNPHPDPA